jgi:glycerol-3-phosphate acyltransferase PlsY
MFTIKYTLKGDIMRSYKTEIKKVKGLIFLAAFLSFIFSIYLYFTGDKQNGTFVGLWVPSILSAGTLLIGETKND